MGMKKGRTLVREHLDRSTFVIVTHSSNVQGPPWWASGSDSALPLQGAWVLSLVWELRSCMLNRAPPPKQTNQQKDKG